MALRLLFSWIFFLPVLASAQSQPAAGAVSLPLDFSLTTVDSTEVTTRQLWGKGKKPTVLAFWLTTCMPCQRELAAYKENYAAWQKQADFRLIAISIDFPQRFRRVGEMARSAGWPFPVYWDGRRLFKDLLPGNLNGLPQVFLFDKNGQLVWQHKKYVAGDENELFAKILEYQK